MTFLYPVDNTSHLLICESRLIIVSDWRYLAHSRYGSLATKVVYFCIPAILVEDLSCIS